MSIVYIVRKKKEKTRRAEMYNLRLSAKPRAFILFLETVYNLSKLSVNALNFSIDMEERIANHNFPSNNQEAVL
jgi:hypothetical protein